MNRPLYWTELCPADVPMGPGQTGRPEAALWRAGGFPWREGCKGAQPGCWGREGLWSFCLQPTLGWWACEWPLLASGGNPWGQGLGPGGSGGDTTFRQSRKSFMPLQLRNISQLSGVSSVMFQSALQENSMTWSHCGRERGLSTARRDGRLLAPREGSPDKTWAPPGQTSPMRGSRKTPLTILSSSFF